MNVRPIPGCPGYHASDDGRIWSSRRRVHVAGRRGAVYDCDGPMRELRAFDRRRPNGKPSPYLSVNIGRNRYVHHLVALAFLGPRPEGAEVCHGPGGSRDNSATNLRYDTIEANRAERELCRGEAWHEAHAHAFSDLIGDAT